MGGEVEEVKMEKRRGGKKKAEEDRMGRKGKKSSMLYGSHTSGPGNKALFLCSSSLQSFSSQRQQCNNTVV